MTSDSISLPAGTVTFLFTDIQGSTELLKQLRDKYSILLSTQRDLMREVFAHWNGKVVDSQADEFFVSFPRATDAISATVEAQKALAECEWPEGVQVLVRMGLHTGEPWLVEEGYVGMDVHRAARIGATGHGGQVLLSETTTSLVRDELPEGVTLKELGRHRLKDMLRPEPICQLVIEDLPSEFPPLKSLEAISVGIPTSLEDMVRSPRVVGACPYRGLSAFREEDAAFFYGREAFAQSLYEAVNQEPMVAVIVGSSGSGKSSVVYAGLLPRLKEEGGWLVVDLRPGNRPFYALAGALISLLDPELSETDRLIEVRKLANALEQEELSLAQVSERILEKHPKSEHLLLLIDQFEELYTLCPDPEERTRFLDTSLAAMRSDEEGRVSPFVFLLTLRADFMGQALTHRPFADTLQETSLIMGPMTRQELRTAVVKPAEMQGAAIEEGLVDRILDDVGQEPGNLPLLEFALTLLWERLDQGWMTHAAYNEIGWVEGDLAKYEDEVFEGLAEDRKETARLALTQLIQPGEGTEDTRRVATRAEVGEQNWDLIQHLAGRRLVVTGRDDAGNDVAEVVHEALIRSWDHLRGWMEADRTFRLWQEDLRADLRKWEDSDRDEGALLRGVILNTAEGWVVERGNELGPQEKQFIQESIQFRERRLKEREQRRRRIMYGLVGGIVVALTLAVTAVLFGQQASREAQRADRSLSTAQAANTQVAAEANTRATAEAMAIEQRQVAEEEREISDGLRLISSSRELIAFAINNVETDPELSVLLAIEAVLATDIPEAQHALHQSLSELRLVKTFNQAQTFGLSDVSYSPDGRFLATGDVDGRIRVWDPETGREISLTQAHENGIEDVAFSPDGSLLFTASRDRTVKVWDVLTTKPSSSEGVQEILLLEEKLILVHPNAVESVDFDPHQMVIATTDGQARLWDANTGQEIWVHPMEGEETLSIAMSPNGDLLATGSNTGVVRIWDIEKGTNVLKLITQHGYVNTLDFNPAGDLLASGGEDSLIKLWSIPPTMDDEASIAGQNESSQALTTLVGHTSQVFKIEFSPDGTRLISASHDETVKVWEIPRGIELFAIPGPFLNFDVHPACVQPPESPFEWCGHHLVTSHWIGILKTWDISPTGRRELMTVPGMYGRFNSDGARVITFHGFDEGAPGVQIWEVPEITAGRGAHNPGSPLLSYKFPVIEGFLNGAISKDSTLWGLIYSDNTIRIFDVLSGELLHTIQAEGFQDTIQWISFHPSGSYIAACADRATGIWDLSTEGEIKRMQIPQGRIDYCEFNIDGSRLETGGLNATTTLWNTENLNDPETIQQHYGHTQPGQIFFDMMLRADHENPSLAPMNWTSENQAFHAQKTQDGEINILDRETVQEVLTVEGSFFNNLQFSPDNTLVLVSDRAQNVVRVFTFSTDQLITLAKARVTRSLTLDEQAVYLHIE
jgi:WD40 repeat protein/class 3 adenylate cyclase